MDLNLLALILVLCSDGKESVMDFDRVCFGRAYFCASDQVSDKFSEEENRRIATKCYYTKGKNK